MMIMTPFFFSGTEQMQIISGLLNQLQKNANHCLTKNAKKKLKKKRFVFV